MTGVTPERAASVHVERDDPVVVAAAAVDHGRPLALLVDEEIEVVADELHLVQGLLEGDRRGLMGLLAHHERTVTGHRHRADLVLDVAVVLHGGAGRSTGPGHRSGDRLGRVLAAMDLAAVGGAPHLRRHLVQREVERSHLVLGGCLGPQDRSLRLRGQLDPYLALRLSGVALSLQQHLDPDDPMVVLLEARELVLHVLAKALRDLALPTADHNVHADLPLMGRGHRPLVTPARVDPPAREVESVRPTWSSTPHPPAETVAA